MADLRDAILAEIERREQEIRDVIDYLIDGGDLDGLNWPALPQQARSYLTTWLPASTGPALAHYRLMLGDHDAWQGDVACFNGSYCTPLRRLARAILPPDVLTAHGIKDGD